VGLVHHDQRQDILKLLAEEKLGEKRAVEKYLRALMPDERVNIPPVEKKDGAIKLTK
jgi:hypothetical protein